MLCRRHLQVGVETTTDGKTHVRELREKAALRRVRARSLLVASCGDFVRAHFAHVLSLFLREERSGGHVHLVGRHGEAAWLRRGFRSGLFGLGLNVETGSGRLVVEHNTTEILDIVLLFVVEDYAVKVSSHSYFSFGLAWSLPSSPV